MSPAGDEGIPIVLRCGEIELRGRLNGTETALKVAGVLPIDSEAGRWGEEIYFEIPVVSRLAPDARDVMQIGEIGYWPPGKAFCVFWGPTPSSRAGEIRAASPVNVIGRIEGDLSRLGAVRDGDFIVVEKA